MKTQTCFTQTVSWQSTKYLVLANCIHEKLGNVFDNKFWFLNINIGNSRWFKVIFIQSEESKGML